MGKFKRLFSNKRHSSNGQCAVRVCQPTYQSNIIIIPETHFLLTLNDVMFLREVPTLDLTKDIFKRSLNYPCLKTLRSLSFHLPRIHRYKNS